MSDPMEMESLSLGTEEDEEEGSHGDLESNRLGNEDNDQPNHVDKDIKEEEETVVTLRELASGLVSVVRSRGILGCCSPGRVFLLIKFFVFNVGFITADIFTDCVGGIGLLKQGTYN